jgi:Ca2+/Na+ antiporter
LCCLFFQVLLFLLAIVLSILFYFSFGHCIVCSFLLFFWSLYCLFFTKRKVEKNRQHNGQKKSRKEQTIQWPKEKVEKNRQHNDQKKSRKEQTIQWTKEK